MSSIGGLRKTLSKVGEDFFLRRLDRARVPEHVAVIMDGNGRWATRRGLERLAGHRAGVGTTRDVVRAAARAGVKHLTLYTFSAENWGRPKGEVGGLMDLLQETMRGEIADLNANGVKVTIFGDIESLPAETRSACSEMVEQTAANERLNLHLALNYGGRQEIVRAVRELMAEAGRSGVRLIGEDDLEAKLFTAGLPDPALMIRTGGEFRLSNFLLWQSAYTELWVTSVLWPDFNGYRFLRALADFGKRRRRFGKVEPGDLG